MVSNTGSSSKATNSPMPGEWSVSTTIESPLPPKSSAVNGASASDISLWVAMVDSVASASGTGSGTPIDGGVIASATFTCGADGSLIEGGTPSSVYLTMVVFGGNSSSLFACEYTYHAAKSAAA